jgi:hypothetical protein
MNRIRSIFRKLPPLEILGLLFVWLGISFAIAFPAVGFSEDHLAKDKQQIAAKMDEMKNALSAAKIPDEQIIGLLKVYKVVTAEDVGHEDFILMSFSILLSLLTALFGWVIVLRARLRTVTKSQQTESNPK